VCSAHLLSQTEGPVKRLFNVASKAEKLCFFKRRREMEKFMQGVNRFIRDEEGVTAIEYGLLAALIAVAIIVSATAVGTQLDAVFNFIQGQLAGALA
jgi:pilus assembly protein Flp/PilA